MSALSRALEGDPRDVEGDDLLAHFAAKDWKPETRKGAKNACVSYFRWLKASGRSEADPSEFLPTVKRPEPHPRPCPDVVILAALRKATEANKNAELLGLMVNDPNIEPEELAQITAPTLVICGTKDMIREDHTRKIAENIPNARLAILEGDHFVANKRSEEFNREVDRFLESL